MDWFKEIQKNYTLIQSIYSLLPYLVGLILAASYSYIKLKNIKYTLLALPLVFSGLLSMLYYPLFRALGRENNDLTTITIVYLPLLFSFIVSVIAYTQVETDKKRSKSKIVANYQPLVYLVTGVVAVITVFAVTNATEWMTLLSSFVIMALSLTSFFFVTRFLNTKK